MDHGRIGLRLATRVRRGLLSGLPVVAAVLVTLYYNDVRFGNPLDTGYLRDDTLGIGSFWAGLAGLLFSPGRSVFLYSPIAPRRSGGLDRHAPPRSRDDAGCLAGEFVIVLVLLRVARELGRRAIVRAAVSAAGRFRCSSCRLPDADRKSRLADGC